MTGFKAKTANSVLPLSIKAPVEEVCPLASPIEEYKWIPGWKCDLKHCPNDTLELGVIIDEVFSAPFLIGNAKGITTWTCVKFDLENFNVHYRLDNEHSSSLFKLEFEDDGKGGTGGKLDFTYTATTPKGNRLVENDMEGKLQIMLTLIRAELKYYAENKELIPISEVKELIPMDKFSISDKIRLFLNISARKKYVDKDRERFLEMWAREEN